MSAAAIINVIITIITILARGQEALTKAVVVGLDKKEHGHRIQNMSSEEKQE